MLARVCGTLEGLSQEQLNRRPPLPGANSAFVIAAHTLGNARAWVLGIACGRPLRRDRPAEFASSGTHGDIEAEHRQLSQEIERALAELTPSRLDERLVPPGELWGEGEPHEISRRQALLHVIEHASIHLGQLQVTGDWIRSG